MATATTTAKPRTAQAQAKNTPQGRLHSNFDFAGYYRYDQPAIRLNEYEFYFELRASGRKIDISGLVEIVTWKDESADTLALVNMQPILTGTMQLRKPKPEEGLPSPDIGIGDVVVCYYGFGSHFHPLWVMRVSPGDSGDAQSLEMADGAWTLTLADDLVLVGRSLDDFTFKKGKKNKPTGHFAHEILASVARQYKIPVLRAAKGTHRFELDDTTTKGATPLSVISAAYQKESDWSGKVFVISWSAPTGAFPTGALQVMPMRRNDTLYVFKDQITSATLSANLKPDFATVITATAMLKHPSGKHKNVTVVVKSAAGIKRWGFVHKQYPAHGDPAITVNSRKELEVIAARQLALQIGTLRTLTLNHPGIPFIRRGDAIRVDIPEEGYHGLAPKPPAKKKVDHEDESTKKEKTENRNNKRKTVAAAQATQSDGSSPTSLASAANTSTASTTATLAPATIADPGIAIVTSVEHTVSSGSYSMTLATSFIDQLDPVNVQKALDAAQRAHKSTKASHKTTVAKATAKRKGN